MVSRIRVFALKFPRVSLGAFLVLSFSLTHLIYSRIEQSHHDRAKQELVGVGCRFENSKDDLGNPYRVAADQWIPQVKNEMLLRFPQGKEVMAKGSYGQDAFQFPEILTLMHQARLNHLASHGGVERKKLVSLIAFCTRAASYSASMNNNAKAVELYNDAFHLTRIYLTDPKVWSEIQSQNFNYWINNDNPFYSVADSVDRAALRMTSVDFDRDEVTLLIGNIRDLELVKSVYRINYGLKLVPFEEFGRTYPLLGGFVDRDYAKEALAGLPGIRDDRFASISQVKIPPKPELARYSLFNQPILVTRSDYTDPVTRHCLVYCGQMDVGNNLAIQLNRYDRHLLPERLPPDNIRVIENDDMNAMNLGVMNLNANPTFSIINDFSDNPTLRAGLLMAPSTQLSFPTTQP